jgi:aminobenzoyl-glutamate utilization protein B
MKSISEKWIDTNKNFLTGISDEIWSFAEVGYQEIRSADLLRSALKKAGFNITDKIAGIPTAFMATWGKGKPKIGFLAEYDALPGLGQKAIVKKQVTREKSDGHGCGHNLLGAGVLGGVLGLKAEMEEENLEGTLVFYGCPAEEKLSGKVFMAREGVFNDLDLALTWHGANFNLALLAGTLAVEVLQFDFRGVTAHAAFDPDNGRSAHDAVELMNVGANYLREHIPQDCRLHYAVTRTGHEPNIVPEFARVEYWIRASSRKIVQTVRKRLEKIAKGAALMTETNVEIETHGGCYELNNNEVIAQTYLDVMKTIGAPSYTKKEKEFAKKLVKTFPDNAAEAALKACGLPESMKTDLFHNGVRPDLLGNKSITMKGSTDVGDVSWITPAAWFLAAAAPIGTPQHSWQNTACAGMSIGHKGMLTAAKVLALTGSWFIRSPESLKACREAFLKDTQGFEYKSPIPENRKYRD